MTALSFKKIKDNRVILIIVSILIIGIAVRCYKFGTLMDSVQSDEMGTGYDAWCLINFGTDRYQKSWPVYFSNYGIHGQSALMTYLCAASFKIFGYGRFALRFPALVVNVLVAVFGILIIRESFHDEKHKYQLVFAILYSISPYTIMASRIALDCNLMFGISTIFLYFIIRAYNTGRGSYYCLAGVFAGLTLYTYSIAYIVMPLMLLCSIVYMVYTKRVKVSDVIAFVIPLFILATPLILVQIINRYDLQEFRLGIFTIIRIMNYDTSDANLKITLLGFLKSIFVSIGFDGIPYNTDSRFFTFYPMSIPLFFVGIFLLGKQFVNSIRSREPMGEALVFLWIICEIMAGGIMTDPNANRMNGIMFGVMYCITIGIVWGYDRLMKYTQGQSKGSGLGMKIVTGVFGLSYLIYFAVFVYTYYTDIAYADVTTSSMCPEAFDFIRNDELLKDKVIATNIPTTTYPASILPSPDKIDENGNYSDERYICYTNYEYDSLREFVFNKGGLDIAYLVYRPLPDDAELFDELGAVDRQFGINFHLYYWE